MCWNVVFVCNLLFLVSFFCYGDKFVIFLIFVSVIV